MTLNLTIGRRAVMAAALLTYAAALLAGCATGGDQPPAYAQWAHGSALHKEHAERVLIPRRTSAEYLRSWGLRLVDAEPAFQDGLTGRGVTVALIDTGLSLAPEEVVRHASPASTDLIADRGLDSPGGRHGGEVAQGVAAALDGAGVVGVAYGATLLSIRADLDGSCRTECAFDTRDLARGLDYAVAHGARIIVLAVEGQHRLNATFEAALQRATDAGAVIVVAAGNEAERDPAWPARYAADPRFARSVIAVGAAGPDGRFAAWSNRAGSTHDRYVVAPGRRVVADCGTQFCNLISGTSFSAPYVAGALALLMEARPDLGAQDAADLLLRSGREQASLGDRLTTGRGLLDIGRALRAARRPTGSSEGASARS